VVSRVLPPRKGDETPQETLKPFSPETRAQATDYTLPGIVAAVLRLFLSRFCPNSLR
jgi:hypothetical protein